MQYWCSFCHWLRMSLFVDVSLKSSALLSRARKDAIRLLFHIDGSGRLKSEYCEKLRY